MTTLPGLGPRGEGWVVLQAALIGAAGLAGLTGPAWSGDVRLATSVAGIAAIVGGGLLVVASARALGPAMTPLPRPGERGTLVVEGPYRHVRHPIYAGGVLVLLGWSALTAAPAAFGLSAAVAAFLVVKSRREEAWLVERYPGYATYRSRTPAFVPVVRLGRGR